MSHPAETTAMVPLSDLYIHPLNTRTEPPPADIEALAESIVDLGLLQNLAGYLDPTTPADMAWKTGIVAGGRRLRALQLLATRDGRDPAKVTVPVKITADVATARLWASAENTARQALHPADEIRAYGRMASQGADPNRIARAFAVTEIHVRRRLKLASLPAPAIQSLREGKISLDQAAALTTARDEPALLAELQRVETSHWGTGPEDIRARLRGDAVKGTDRRAKWIGLDAYREAGGEVQEDLFTEQTRLLDDKLLDALFRTRLTAEAENYRQSTGWKWVEPWFESSAPFERSYKMQRIDRTPVDLPDADLDELTDLQDRAEQDALTDAEFARMNELETRAAGDYSDEDRATSGVWLYLNHQGELAEYGPYRHPEDDPASATAEDGDGDAGAVQVESRALPANLIDDLKRIRLAALQLKAGESSELMLDLLAWQLSGDLRTYAAALQISTTPAPIAPEKPEGTTLPARLADRDPLGGKDSPDAAGFAAFRALGKKHRNDVIARALARLLPTNDLAPALAAMLRPAVREIWTPTKSGYLSRLPGSLLDQIWCDLVPDGRAPDHASFRGLKKADKANLLHQLFEGPDLREALGLSRDQNARIDAWLPAELQWPTIEADTEEQEDAA